MDPSDRPVASRREARAVPCADPGAAVSRDRATSLYLPMHDGVRIAVDVLLPKGLPPRAKVPALFKIARFGRAPLDGSLADEDRFWVTHGFARVLIDERGTGASFGTSAYGSGEVSDLREITDWVVKQPWSNGRVGAIGISVEGTASELLAATGHPAVRAVAPLFSDYNFYTDLIRPGGVYHEWLMKNFGSFVKEMDSGGAAKRVTADVDGSLLKQAIADHANPLPAEPRQTLLVHLAARIPRRLLQFPRLPGSRIKRQGSAGDGGRKAPGEADHRHAPERRR